MRHLVFVKDNDVAARVHVADRSNGVGSGNVTTLDVVLIICKPGTTWLLLSLWRRLSFEFEGENNFMTRATLR